MQMFRPENRAQIEQHDDEPRERHVDGRITRLYTDYGFIETHEAESVYFHRHSLRDVEFDALRVGQHVRVLLEDGLDGIQASVVTLLHDGLSLDG